MKNPAFSAPPASLPPGLPPPTTAEEFCYQLLTRGELAVKLAPPRRPDGRLLPLAVDAAPRRLSEPARTAELRMRPGAEPLPGLGRLRDPEARALCLERFAHHELQAIELFAWMLLAFPGPPLTPGLRRALLLTLEEEQVHLRLYLDRLRDHGWWLGRSQLSDYLWQHHEGVLRAPEPALSFLCAMGLTFEQANLDFTLLYRDGFRAAGDEPSAQVLQRVHDEEIRHVRVAMHWLRRLKDPARSEVDTYQAAVPFPLSAARAKGRRFDIAARHRAGLPDAFIAFVRAARPYESPAERPPRPGARLHHDGASQPGDPVPTEQAWRPGDPSPIERASRPGDPSPIARASRPGGLPPAEQASRPGDPSPSERAARPGDLSAAAQAWRPGDPVPIGWASSPMSSLPATPAGSGQRLWLLPNLGAEEDRPLPAGARGFLRGVIGAWALLFDAESGAGPPLLLPPGETSAQARWREALHARGTGPALACLRGLSGFLAWLGTEQAAAQAAAQGHTWLGPAPAVVRRVHDKAFAHRAALAGGLVPPDLRELLWELSPDELLAADATARINARVATWPAWTGSRFTLKPRYGTSGRGRVMGTGELPAPRAPLQPGAPHPALAQLAARGGCLLEPWLERVRDLSLQLYVHPEGRTEVLGTTTQLLTPSGQILGNRGVLRDGQVLSGAPDSDERELSQAAAVLGAAAAQAGFYGVAGIDAFVFRAPAGGELVRPVVELNARFTTGTVAVGLVRLAERVGLTAGLNAWALLLKAKPPSGLAALDPGELRAITPLSHGPSLVLARTPEVLDAWLSSP